MNKISKLLLSLSVLSFTSNSYAQSTPACDITLQGFLNTSKVASVIDSGADINGDGQYNVCFRGAVLIDSVNTSALTINKPVRLTGIGAVNTNQLVTSKTKGNLLDINASNVTIDNLTLIANGELSNAVVVRSGTGLKFLNSNISNFGRSSTSIFALGGQIDSIDNCTFTLFNPSKPLTGVYSGVVITEKATLRTLTRSRFFANDFASQSIRVSGGQIGRITDNQFDGGTAIAGQLFGEIGSIARSRATNMAGLILCTYNCKIGSVRDSVVTLKNFGQYVHGVFVRDSKIQSIDNLNVSTFTARFSEGMRVINSHIGSITGLQINLPVGGAGLLLNSSEVEQIDDFIISVNEENSAAIYLTDETNTGTKQLGTLSNGVIAVLKTMKHISNEKLVNKLINVSFADL